MIFAEKVRKIVHCVFTLGWHKLDKTQEHSRKLYPMVSVFLPLRGCGPLGWTNVSLVSCSFKKTCPSSFQQRGNNTRVACGGASYQVF